MTQPPPPVAPDGSAGTLPDRQAIAEMVGSRYLIGSGRTRSSTGRCGSE